jgi:hypothetical protein
MQRLLREIEHITSKSSQSLFKKELLKLSTKDAEDVGAFLEASRKHTELMNQYWPTSSLSPEEKLRRTANKVGLELPKQAE